MRAWVARLAACSVAAGSASLAENLVANPDFAAADEAGHPKAWRANWTAFSRDVVNGSAALRYDG